MGKKSTAGNTNSANEELHSAARSGDLIAVQTICATNPLAVNSRDRHSRTPLHLAAWSGHADVVSYLCKNKADIGASAMDDMGAIHFAAQKGHLEVIKILHSAGMSLKSYNRKGMTALHYAAQGSYLELVKYLAKKGANVDAKNKAGNSAAGIAGSEEVRKFLVEWNTASGKAALADGEKDEKAEQKSSPELEEDKLDDDEPSHLDGTIEEQNRTTSKRKVESESKENLQATKKSKVSLNHLLAMDDTQDEEENK